MIIYDTDANDRPYTIVSENASWQATESTVLMILRDCTGHTVQYRPRDMTVCNACFMLSDGSNQMKLTGSPEDLITTLTSISLLPSQHKIKCESIWNTITKLLPSEVYMEEVN